MNLELKKLVAAWKAHKDYRDQIVHEQIIPARRARYAALEPHLPQPLEQNLRALGINKLFTHQARAIELLRQGRDVVVVTETASGKSMCYHLPVLETLLAEPDARALYLFPTKALAQDQSRALHALIDPNAEFNELKNFHAPRIMDRRIAFGTYDGDTPSEDRAAIRSTAGILLTNPDMLSLGILPNHSRLWTKFFARLKFVVVDELHVYRGVFGSHVANVMRRLERICAFYGSKPQYICCSATTANPAEHSALLLHREPAAITESGAPSARKTFLLWNPPVTNELLGVRASSLNECVALFSDLVRAGARTIVFARAKPTVELILRFTRDRLKDIPEDQCSIAPYRGGYLPSDRRLIEKQLSEGALHGVTCTNALELGVDIGSLDAAVLNGFPGAIASAWQQAGRAGRRGRESLAVLVAHDEPLDQYFMRHPEYFFGRGMEHAIINPANPYIQKMHLKAASHEIPLSRNEEPLFGHGFAQQVRDMIKSRDMKQVSGRAAWAGAFFPAEEINLRTATAERYSICLPDATQIGMMDADTAFQYLHDGAVYLHLGEAYLVTRLDIGNRVAWVEKKTMPYYTRALSREDVTIEQRLRNKDFNGTPVHFGFVNITHKVHSYKKINPRTQEVIARVDLDYPSETLWTQSMWFIVNPEIVQRVLDRGLDIMGGLHAVEHASIAMLPFLAMCDRDDIGGLSTNEHPDTGHATVFIHDAYPGGMGLAETGYNRIEDLLHRTLDLIQGCACKSGCPSCIHSPKCGNMNEPLDKEAALAILKSLLRRN